MVKDGWPRKKTRKPVTSVKPALDYDRGARVHNHLITLDSRVPGNDENGRSLTFYEFIKYNTKPLPFKQFSGQFLALKINIHIAARVDLEGLICFLQDQQFYLDIFFTCVILIS